MNIRSLYEDYKSVFYFGIGMLLFVFGCYWGAHFIPLVFYTSALNAIMNGTIAAVCLFGTFLMACHRGGMRARTYWIIVLLMHAVCSALMLMKLISFVGVTDRGFISLSNWEILSGNVTLWTLLLYPIEVLRPGWMTYKWAFLQWVPVLVAFALDEIFDIDLRILIAIYPLFLLSFLGAHITKYRQWCEENYSSMDDISVEWIIRYIIMFLLNCGLYIIHCFTASMPIVFAQQCLLVVMMGYSTEQILFRPDPWKMMRSVRPQIKEEPEETEQEPEQSRADYRAILEAWMEEEKPYCNPEFRLLDLRQVLPLNRTYLSQLINFEYGCTFYQFVTNYRIEEAKRLMREHPNRKMQEIAELSGFSSPTVFARVFARETGKTPSEWSSQAD